MTTTDEAVAELLADLSAARQELHSMVAGVAAVLPADGAQAVLERAFRALVTEDDAQALAATAALAVVELAEQRATPATFAFPREPSADVTALWDKNGDRWTEDGSVRSRGYRFWRRARDRWVVHYPDLLLRVGPLSTTSPTTDAEEASTE